ncbi:hypothetical protein AMS68_003579 [Peltaster fructicola]|uniref:Uncharacterized protein n=1 Tax=Peltaster fructicola TaxID=286661 RepID=A0A6H0XTG1_9PEZI|nr:hypothetical protein AMS68_003579 [Peltaster fructicola]
MPYQLKGRNVLVTAGSRGLGAAIVRKFAAEGCNIVINYVSNAEAADTLAKEVSEQYPDLKILTLRADCGVTSAVDKLVKDSIGALGGLDIVIGNAGWTRFSDWSDLDAMSEEEWDKCWKTNVLGMKQCLSSALPTFKANPEGGVLIITSSVAGKTLSGSSMAYSVTKAAQTHLMKCMANTQGPKVRVNAVLPGLMLTEWGARFGEDQLNALKARSALQKETDIEDCADAYIMLAKNTSMTGQNIIVDSGIAIQNM